MLPVVRRFIVVCAVLALAGCAIEVGPGASASPIPSPTGPTDIECPLIDLRDQAGARISLTGTWAGNDGAYYSLLQQGNCLWGTGISSRRLVTIRGTIHNDFTVLVESAVVSCGSQPEVCATGSGTAVLRIDLTSEGTVLRVETPAEDPRNGYTVAVSRLDRVSTTTIFPPPTPGI
jgi:hypothetical protein